MHSLDLVFKTPVGLERGLAHLEKLSVVLCLNDTYIIVRS